MISLYQALINLGYGKTSFDNEDDNQWALDKLNEILKEKEKLEIKLNFVKELFGG